ncbi:uncharacterized protein LY79DRAFT_587755 [Colletotrichum navitas]|uniref:2EXR domain-containing protein n=1 Tax=Colletotrichum navitas TaxID=681940 RepID=A0AAD8Q744_9PEZI|nr:uncharacterized protein LY79DRAFT_587755 [Colletotrichum navitas]KAK1596920.1 hypothetical protein LY79DRAFT_587755 [Colletotrichum navitas]
MAGFGLFGSLPVELRLKIWRFALEHEEPRPQARRHMPATLVSYIGGERGEHKLPAVSAISRESRKEFLRLYVRFLDPQAPAHRSPQSHGYAHPRMVLGIHVDYDEASMSHGVASTEQEQYTLGYMTDAPVLPQAAREQIREVRLHDVDFVARAKGSVQIFDPDPSVGPRSTEAILSRNPLCDVRLPPLRLPNLSAVQIVSLSIPQTELRALFGPRFHTHYDFRFRYSQSSGTVYVALASFRWFHRPLGCRMLQLGFSRPWPRVFIRIELCFIWRLSAQYVALRLGQDRSRG